MVNLSREKRNVSEVGILEQGGVASTQPVDPIGWEGRVWMVCGRGDYDDLEGGEGTRAAVTNGE